MSAQDIIRDLRAGGERVDVTQSKVRARLLHARRWLVKIIWRGSPLACLHEPPTGRNCHGVVFFARFEHPDNLVQDGAESCAERHFGVCSPHVHKSYEYLGVVYLPAAQTPPYAVPAAIDSPHTVHQPNSKLA